MNPSALRLVFTLIFSVLSTAVASVAMYTLPVLYYAGYQTQVPPIIMGFLAGALIFSIAGTLLVFYTKRPLYYGIIISTVIAAALMAFYKLSGPVNNVDLFIGSMASESFSVFFATMFQGYPRSNVSRLTAMVSIIIFTLVNVALFIATAEIYLNLGQEYLPNIIVYLELMAAVLSAITILLFARPVRRNNH